MKISVKFIQERVWLLGARIGAPKNLTMVFAKSPQNGKPHIEIHDGEFHYICSERGHIFSIKSTHSFDELLYWIFQSITFEMAQESELIHRNKSDDSRRLLFSKQIELLNTLCSRWAKLRQEEIDAILENHPFVDQ